ncbi:MAG: TRAP transporter small permease [Desulfoferrobacter sp.]
MISGLHRQIGKIHLWSNWANHITEIFLFVIGLGMALIIGTQVFSRYVLNHSLFWSEEVGRICLVWISFLGASAAYKRRAHIGVDFLVARLPHNLRYAVAILVLVLSLVFFGVLIVYGTIFAAFISGQKTAALGLPLTLTYTAIPLSGALFSLHALSHLCKLIDPLEGSQ